MDDKARTKVAKLQIETRGSLSSQIVHEAVTKNFIRTWNNACLPSPLHVKAWVHDVLYNV